jgi:hypothetical protein
VTIAEYEVYSDERWDKTLQANHMCLGGIICTNKGCARLLSALASVRTSERLDGEAGWKKVSNYHIEAYKKWLDIFFDDPHARFNLLVVNLGSADWQTMKGRSKRDQYLASTYYQFLLTTFGRLSDTKRWWVYPDAGFFSRDKVLDQVEFVFNRTYKKAFPKSSRVIRLARARDSKKHDLIQLADLLLGCEACTQHSITPDSVPRKVLLDYYQDRRRTTPTTERRFAKISVRDWVLPEKFTYSQLNGPILQRSDSDAPPT